MAPAGITTNRASGRPRHFASRLEGLQLRIRDLRRRPVSVFDRTPREPGGALFARSHAVAERLRRQPWRCHVETAKIATFSQRTCSLYPDSFLDASDRIFSRQGLKACHTFARKSARLHVEGEGQDNRWRGDGARHRGVARHRRIGAVIGGIGQSHWRRRGNFVLLRRQQELCSPPENYVYARAPRLTAANTKLSCEIDHNRPRDRRRAARLHEEAKARIAAIAQTSWRPVSRLATPEELCSTPENDQPRVPVHD